MAEVRDPVCGMYIEPVEAVGESTWEGVTYWFCSEECLAQFESDPEQYADVDESAVAEAAAGDDGPELERHEPPRTTQGRFTAPKFGSAGSGGLEYELLPEAHEDGEEDDGER